MMVMNDFEDAEFDLGTFEPAKGSSRCDVGNVHAPVGRGPGGCERAFGADENSKSSYIDV